MRTSARSRAPRGSPPARGSGAACDLQERLVALHLALRARALLRVLLGPLHGVAGLLQARLEGAAVDVVGGYGLFDQDERRVVDDLQVALALGEANNVAFALVEAELCGLEDGHEGRMVGEHADRAGRGAGRDHLDLVLEDLALGREDLDGEAIPRHRLPLLRAPAPPRPPPRGPPRPPRRSSPSAGRPAPGCRRACPR